MNYFPFVVFLLIRCVWIHAAETKQNCSTENHGTDLIVSESLISLLNIHPSQNTKLLNLIGTTTLKIQGQKDGILQKIRQSASKNSVSQAIMAMEKSYECTINSSHSESLSLPPEEMIKRLNIYFNAKFLPVETRNEALELIDAIIKNGKIGESFEFLFKVSSEQFWTLKITLKKGSRWINPKMLLKSKLNTYKKVTF